MKLIRLSKKALGVTKYKGDKLIFNTTFKDDFTVKPNAKIAFQSIFFNEFSQDVIIDATNDIINNTLEGVPYSIILNRDEYTPTTYDVFFSDFTNKLNANVPFDDRNIGREWRVSLNQNGLILIEYKFGSIGTENLEFTNAQQVGGVFSAVAPIIANNNYFYNRNAMAKGSGFIRGRVNTVGNMIIGLTLSPLNNNSGPLDQASWYYAVGIEGGNYVYYLTGVKNVTGVVAQIGDIMDMHYDQGEFKTVYYRGGVENILDTLTDPTQTDNLYPFVLFKDTVGNMNNFNFSDNPYLNDLTKIVNNDNLGIPEPDPLDMIVDVTMTFQTDEFMRLLGFTTNPISLFNQNQVIFKGINKFDAESVKYLYSVKLTNTPLESYDGETQGKSQILYIINELTKGDDVSFTAPYLTFLELKNDKPLSLRNIRCEVVNDNDDIVEFYDKAIMSLIIDDEN